MPHLRAMADAMQVQADWERGGPSFSFLALYCEQVSHIMAEFPFGVSKLCFEQVRDMSICQGFLTQAKW